MTQHDFNSAFQHIVAGGGAPHDPRYVMEEIIRRDRVRTRLLAAVSILFWLAGTTGMLLMVIGLNKLVLYIRISDYEQHHASATQPDFSMLEGTSLIHHSMPWIAGSVVSLMLAALFTVVLIFSSRQATLNRISVSLMTLSEQLKDMRQSEKRS